MSIFHTGTVRHVAIHKAHALILHAVACHLGREILISATTLLLTVFVSRRIMATPELQRRPEALLDPFIPMNAFCI
jgi:hypothetical protein